MPRSAVQFREVPSISPPGGVRPLAPLTFLALLAVGLGVEDRQLAVGAHWADRATAPIAAQAQRSAQGFGHAAAQRWRAERLADQPTPDWPASPTPAAGPDVLSGVYQPLDRSTAEATGAVGFFGAGLRFARGGALQTSPHRLLYADAPLAAAIGAPVGATVELRRILPAGKTDAELPPILCDGARPGWVAAWRQDDRVGLALFEAGAAPDPADPGGVCPTLAYERR